MGEMGAKQRLMTSYKDAGSIAELERRIRCLEKENEYLKNLLADAGIFYSEKGNNNIVNGYDPEQGAGIIPGNIAETDAKVFFSMFCG